MCVVCVRLREGLMCEAYPDGIPTEIIMCQWDQPSVPEAGRPRASVQPERQRRTAATVAERGERKWPMNGSRPSGLSRFTARVAVLRAQRYLEQTA